MSTSEPALALQRTLQTVGLVIAPATLLTALLAYFGWVRTRAQSLFLGLDASVLSFSTEDYVLRSIGPMFWPVASMLVAVLAAAWLHAWLLVRTANGASPWIRGAAAALAGLGVAALVLGAVRAPWQRLVVGGASLRPLAFLVGVAATAYGLGLLRRTAESGSQLRGVAAWLGTVSRIVVALLLAGGLFWGVGNYAHWWGLRAASQLADSRFAGLPSVVVYSEQDLLLNAQGVVTEVVDDPDARYRHRATGLRLLVAFDDRYVLVPEGWSRAEPVVLLVERDSGVRLDFRRASP